MSQALYHWCYKNKTAQPVACRPDLHMWNLGVGEASVAQIGDQEFDARDKVRASCSWSACRENSCVGRWPGSGDRVGVGLPWGAGGREFPLNPQSEECLTPTNSWDIAYTIRNGGGGHFCFSQRCKGPLIKSFLGDLVTFFPLLLSFENFISPLKLLGEKLDNSGCHSS